MHLFFPESSQHKGFKLGLTILLLFGCQHSFSGFGRILSSENVGSITQIRNRTLVQRPVFHGPGYLDWGFLELDDFSLLKGEVLEIQQSRPDSSLVIRVKGNGPTSLKGKIKSNGRVLIIDSLGMNIGGVVRASSFVASTADFSDEELKKAHQGPITSRPTENWALIKVSGTIITEGGVFTDSFGIEQRFFSNVIFLGSRIRVSGNVIAENEGNITLLAADLFQIEMGVDVPLQNIPQEPSGWFAANSDYPLVELKPNGSLGTAQEPAGHIVLSGHASQSAAHHLFINDEMVLQLNGKGFATKNMIIDGGGHGPTLLDGAQFKLQNGAEDGKIDVFGAEIMLFDSILDTTGGATSHQIRIGGDETDLGTDRDGEDGTRLAFSTRIGSDVNLLQDDLERLHITGYAVLQEGELPVLLVSGHDGPMHPPWLLDRETVYNNVNCTFDISDKVSTGSDTDVTELLQGMEAQFEGTTGKKPYTLELRIHRTYVDVNRRPGVATGFCHTDDSDLQKYSYGPNPENNLAYDSFHDLLGKGQQAMASVFGKGLMLDLHGHQDNGTQGPVHLGYNIDGDDLAELLEAAVGPNFDATDFDDPEFESRLNDYSAHPDDLLFDMVKRSSSKKLILDSATNNNDTGLWDVMFGGDSLYRQMEAKSDALGNDYLLYIVQDVDYMFKLRRGGFTQRRHGSSDASKDACHNPEMGTCQNNPHNGFEATVDGIQLEVPQQYRKYDGNFDQDKQDVIDQFRQDMADAVIHYLEFVYHLNF